MIIDVSEKNLKIIIDELKKGKNVCIPTDTVYGLIASARSSAAVKNIFYLKRRGDTVPLAMLCKDFSQILEFVIENKFLKVLGREFWPGPLTIILPVSDTIDSKYKHALDIAVAGGRTIGIRIANSALVCRIIEMLGCPVYATSVNFSGSNSLNNSEDIERNFVRYLDEDILVLKSEINNTSGISSTVIDLTAEPVVLLREGNQSLLIKEYMQAKGIDFTIK